MAKYKTKGVARIGAAAVFLATLVSAPVADATSTTIPTGTIGLYIDAPFVQGSYANTATTRVESFDNHNFDPVSNTLACATATPINGGTLGPTCTIHGPESAASPAYSASTTSGNQTVGGSVSGFLTGYPGTEYQIQLSETKKYVGFLWATGSPGNTVQFFSNNALVAEISIDGVSTTIGIPPANFSQDNSFVTTISGTMHYPKKLYFHNPRDYTLPSNNSPMTDYPAGAVSPQEPFVYIHAFAGDGVGFNRVVFKNSGFEIDNFTTSTEAVEVNPRLVLIENIPALATYEGLAVTSGPGTDWIPLNGRMLARTGASGPAFETVYWYGRDTAGNWNGPQALTVNTQTIRTRDGTDSIEVKVPPNSYTHYIFWVDWCPNYASPANCVPFHFGEFDVSTPDTLYRYEVTRSITYATSGHGSIQGSTSQTVTYGSDATSVTAVPVQGGQFIRWSDDSANPPTIQATRTDLALTETKTVTAVFSSVNRTLNTTAGANGSVSPSGQTSVSHGNSQAVVITPASGYEVDSCIIDAASSPTPCGVASSGGTYTFQSITSDRTLAVTFRQIPVVSSPAPSNPPVNNPPSNDPPSSQNTTPPSSGFEQPVALPGGSLNKVPGVSTSPTWTRMSRTVTGFEFEKSLETQEVSGRLQSVINDVGFYQPVRITCQGFTGFNWHSRSSAFLIKLATERATITCARLQETYPSAQVNVLKPRNLNSKSPLARKVVVTFHRPS